MIGRSGRWGTTHWGGGWWITQILRVEWMFIRDLVSHTCSSTAGGDGNTVNEIDVMGKGKMLGWSTRRHSITSRSINASLYPSILAPFPPSPLAYLVSLAATN